MSPGGVPTPLKGASSRIVTSVAVSANRVGASLTGVMVISTVLVSVLAPPTPVLPWSSMVMMRDCSFPVPTVFVFAVGVNFSVASAALIFALVPVNTILGSAVPSPVVNVRPVTVVIVIVPLGELPKSSVTFSSAPKSSGSATDMPVMAVLLESSATVSAAGALSAGASLVPEMLILKNLTTVFLPSTPTPSLPLPTPPNLSSTVVVIFTVMSAFGLVGV